MSESGEPIYIANIETIELEVRLRMGKHEHSDHLPAHASPGAMYICTCGKLMVWRRNGGEGWRKPWWSEKRAYRRWKRFAGKSWEAENDRELV